MAVAIASNLKVHVGGRALFADVSFKLEPRERMTLSGRNGAGKSTLLRILAGELAADSGTLSLAKGARVALHDQRPPRGRALSLGDYVFSGRAEMIRMEEQLGRLEAAISSGEEQALAAYAAAQERFELAGGYRWRDGIAAVLHGLGFGDDELERMLSTFSGGELTRASLARALAQAPELLLLDEPTNHLDIPSLEWLEKHLVSLDSAIVLVAHDRWFLESVGTSVLELEAGRARYFAGPWHAWRTERAARELAAGREIERQQAEIARMEKFVERFRAKATKARQAQSRLKQIERVKREATTLDPRDTRTLRFNFAEPERSGRIVLTVEDAEIKAGERVLIDSASLVIERGEHVALVGANGSGKTTLINAIAAAAERTALTATAAANNAAADIRLGHKVQLGYLSQHAETAAGDGTVLEAVQRETGLSGQKARDLLGGFLFSDVEVDKRLADISGGEQRRLSLAILVASGANFLILDEPTNHLDLDSREALEDALLAFEGAVLLVSHDRALLEAVGSRTVVCGSGTLRSYEGGWAENFERWGAVEAPGEQRPSGEAPGSPQRSRKESGLSKNAARKVENLLLEIERAEAHLQRVEEELSDPDAWASPRRTDRAARRHAEAKSAVAELYARWEEADR